MNKLTILKLDNFSNLISLIHNNQEFSVSILLLLEASSIRSLIMIPSLFSVVVESLSKIISKIDEEKVFPIDDKDISNKIKKELNEVLDLYEKSMTAKGFKKLKGRIDNINSPTIKKHLTNNEKLILPFEELEIELSENDIKTIEHRNDLLHGNILLLGEGKKTGSEIDNYMGYVSAKLFTLISLLVLKRIGYSGYVINQSKYYEKSSGMHTDEEYYRLI